MKGNKKIIFIFLILEIFTIASSRKHQLILVNDIRKYFSITTFGFSTNGQLEVTLNYLTFLSKFEGEFGFTLAKTVSDSITPYMESHQNKCLLTDDDEKDENVEIVSFKLNPLSSSVVINCNKLVTKLEIVPLSDSNKTLIPTEVKRTGNIKPQLQSVANSLTHHKRSVDEPDPALSSKNESAVLPVNNVPPLEVKPVESESNSDKKEVEHANVVEPGISTNEPVTCNLPTLLYKNVAMDNKKVISYLQFMITVKNEQAQGLYSFFFHNCAGYKESAIPVNLSISIVERNGENYLSAGEIPLPRLYFFMSVVFFVTGCVWFSFVRKKKMEAFKIHYLMAILVFVKSLSLLFHGINFHIIAKDGFPMEAWAVLYYITHLLKGALLFITIVLIGTGWAFIKHILNDKDKKIFMIVIPLQVLANVAKIIMEESEEGDSQHYYWREIFILVDLMCCGAIMFPVVWSIRHLQEASQTDGKAAINLEKLKLFRHFYIMIVCYIYFTRIIVYLLKITVPFQYTWLDEMFREAATLAFFIMTGYNFRPTTSNPYFRLPQDEDLEMDEVVTQTRFTESLTKTMRSREVDQYDETAPTKRESSHEYD